MVPPRGQWDGTVQVPVYVCTFSDKIVMVDACAAALSPQCDGAAFSRSEALRIAAMAWLKERQARGAPAPRIVKIFELMFLLELTPLPSLALRFAFCPPLSPI